jgi:hypothetical protein
MVQKFAGYTSNTTTPAGKYTAADLMMIGRLMMSDGMKR